MTVAAIQVPESLLKCEGPEIFVFLEIIDMVNYYKYLPVNPDAVNWGLCVTAAGCGRIDLSENYPHTDHPAHHYFDWKKGRVLQEYQLIYIPRGEGIFESESVPPLRITEGAVIFLFPDEWHRYKPDTGTGWDEYWVGFKGGIMDNLVKHGFLEPTAPCLQIGINEQVVSIFEEIIEKTKQERSGYQPLISGAVVHLLGLIHSISREHNFEDQQTAILNMVNKARILIRANVEQQISPEKIADELGLNYSWFRKTFKAYTGIAPGQYLIQLKIEKAKMLLSDPGKSVKEVAHTLNFDSSFYFSKLFKEKTGLPPEKYRKKIFRDVK